MDGLGRRGIDSVSSFFVVMSSSAFFSSIVDLTLGGMLVELLTVGLAVLSLLISMALGKKSTLGGWFVICESFSVHPMMMPSFRSQNPRTDVFEKLLSILLRYDYLGCSYVNPTYTFAHPLPSCRNIHSANCSMKSS